MVLAMPTYHSGDLVKAQRQKLHWTQVQLAEKSKVPQATISQIEATGRGLFETFVKLASAMGVSTDDLIVRKHRAAMK